MGTAMFVLEGPFFRQQGSTYVTLGGGLMGKWGLEWGGGEGAEGSFLLEASRQHIRIGPGLCRS
jgi:hypothetical protein